MIYVEKIGCRAALKSLRRSVVAGVVVVLSWLAVSCSVFDDPLPSYSDSSLVNVGDQAPSFVVESIQGEWLSVGGEGDPATLLVLFSHTCPDCKALLDAIKQKIDSGVEPPRIVAVSRGGTLSEIEDYAEQNAYTIPMAADPDAKVYYQYATMYVPRCYVIDGEGCVQYMSYENSAEQVDALLSHAALH